MVNVKSPVIYKEESVLEKQEVPMKPIKTEKNKQNKKPVFNLLVAQKDQNFKSQLDYVIRECETLFPHIDFKIEVDKKPEAFNLKKLDNKELVFIEDGFLLNIPKQKVERPDIKQDVVLLLDGHFIGDEAFKLKEAIHENSLNLTGHISLTNYPYNLIKLLVVDFIKSKLHLYDRE